MKLHAAVSNAIKDVRKRWGHYAWSDMSATQRQALVRAEVLANISAIDTEHNGGAAHIIGIATAACRWDGMSEAY